MFGCTQDRKLNGDVSIDELSASVAAVERRLAMLSRSSEGTSQQLKVQQQESIALKAHYMEHFTRLQAQFNDLSEDHGTHAASIEDLRIRQAEVNRGQQQLEGMKPVQPAPIPSNRSERSPSAVLQLSARLETVELKSISLEQQLSTIEVARNSTDKGAATSTEKLEEISKNLQFQLESKFDAWKKNVDSEFQVIKSSIEALKPSQERDHEQKDAQQREGTGDNGTTDQSSLSAPKLQLQSINEPAFNDTHEADPGGKERANAQLSPRSGGSSPNPYDLHYYEFQESIWDAALFIGTAPMGMLGSITMLCLFLINITMQIIYTIIVLLEFTIPVFGKEEVRGFEEFRNRIAHDIKYADPLSLSSLASRICDENSGMEVAGAQLNALLDIRGYIPERDAAFGRYTGQIMCWLACITWALVVTKEIKTCGRVFLALLKCAKDRGLNGGKTALTLEEDAWQIRQISIPRFIFMQSVTLLRVAISAILLGSGLSFLVHTISLTDLVLNAMALECVLSLDELIFEAFAPSPVMMFLSSLAGLPSPEWCFAKGADLHAIIGFFGSAIVLLATVPQWLANEVKNLNAVSHALCGGDTKFVVGDSSFAPFMVWAEAEDPENQNVNTYKRDMIDTIIKGDIPGNTLWREAQGTKQGVIKGSTWAAEAVNGWTVGASATRWNTACKDMWDILGPGKFYDYTKALEFRGAPNAKSCLDLKQYCEEDTPAGSASRGICPQTCGCDSPRSELVMTATAAGCPSTCERQPVYKAALDAANCSDSPLEVLKNDPTYVHMATTIPQIAIGAKWPSFAVPTSAEVRGKMLTLGCDAVDYLKGDQMIIPIDLCDEGDVRTFPWKSMRLYCPVKCNCTAHARNCPTRCPQVLLG